MATVKKLLGDVLGKLVFRELTVDQARSVAPGFRRLDLSGEGMRGAPFEAGDKVQIMLDGDMRTYTPFAVDRARGALSFLVYSHGDSPGAAWGRRVAVGDRIRVFGPRGSLPLTGLTGPVLLFGDETSFAVARALRDARGGDVKGTAFVFEVTSKAAAAAALAHLELGDAQVVERRGEAHLDEVELQVRRELAAQPLANLVLTGKAQSIQALRARLKAKPPTYAGQKVKPYWAVGKRGLD
jgi:ferric-chelate reductase (NADPH)